MPTDYVSILRNKGLLKSWTEVARVSEFAVDEEKIEKLGEKKDIFLSSKALTLRDGRIFLPRLELILQGLIEELLHTTLNDLEQDRLIVRIAQTVQTFQTLLEKVGRDYENSYRSQFGKFRILVDKVREIAKGKIQENRDRSESSKSEIEIYEEVRQTLNQGVLGVIQNAKKDVEKAENEIEQNLGQLSAEIAPLLNIDKNTGNRYLEILQETQEFISKQEDTFKEKFVSYKSRTMTGIELIKMEINKINQSQTKFINDLDELLSKIMFNSIEQLTNQTETIVDQIFLDMRKTLDGIRLELQKISEVTEQESIEGIENLVSSVFDMNVEILQHQAEALKALKESSASVKENQIANLTNMEEDLIHNVKATSEDLGQNIESLRRAKELTKESISDIIQMMLQVEKDMLGTYIGNIDLISDLATQSLTQSSGELNGIQRMLVGGFSELEKFLLKDEDGRLENLIFNLAVSKFSQILEEIWDQFEIKPRNEGFVADEVIRGRLNSIKENITMNFTQEVVDLKRATEGDQVKTITEMLEKMKEELNHRMSSFQKNTTMSFERIQEFQTQFKSQAADILSNLDETKRAFEQETIAEIDDGFEQILNALISLNSSLNLFWSSKIPMVFENTKRRTENLEGLFTEILDKASSLANKNITKLEQNRENVGLILTREFSALKETLISSLNQQFTSLNNRILRRIEDHRESITRKIKDSSNIIYERLSKELDKPLIDFVDLRNEIIDSIDNIENLRIKEIDSLSFEIVSLIGKISTTLRKTLNDEIKDMSKTQDQNIREVALILERVKRKLKPFITDIYVNVEVGLYSLLSTSETDLDVLKQQTLHLYDTLGKVNSIIDNSFAKILSDLNLLQKNLQPSVLIRAMSQGSINLMDKLKEFAKEAGLSSLDLTLLELLGNLVEITGKPPEFDLRRFEEKIKIEFPQETNESDDVSDQDGFEDRLD